MRLYKTGSTHSLIWKKPNDEEEREEEKGMDEKEDCE
jgi:hypothetical protein